MLITMSKTGPNQTRAKRRRRKRQAFWEAEKPFREFGKMLIAFGQLFRPFTEMISNETRNL